MKTKHKIFYKSIVIIALLLTLIIYACEKMDENSMYIYNATSATIGWVYNNDTDNDKIPQKNIQPNEYYLIQTGESCSLHHIFGISGNLSTDTVAIYKNGTCVKKWGGPLISRPDKEYRSYFNLQSWEERPGEKKREKVRFIFTITEEDLKQSN